MAKFVLIGSGLAGGLLAAYLGRRGYEVDLYERRADPREGNIVGGRSINLAISTRGIHALEKIGIADEALRYAIPMRGRMIHDKSGELHFTPYDVDPKKCINSIGRAGLNATVIEAAQRYSNVRVHFNHKCTDVDIESAVAHLESANSVVTARGDAVLGVDGAFSAVRQSMQLKIGNFQYRRKLSRPRLQRTNDSTRSRRFVAHGEERAPHLAAEKFHDDRAAEPGWLVHVHTLLGIRRPAQLRYHEKS